MYEIFYTSHYAVCSCTLGDVLLEQLELKENALVRTLTLTTTTWRGGLLFLFALASCNMHIIIGIN